MRLYPEKITIPKKYELTDTEVQLLKLTRQPNWLKLINWALEHPYGTITITFQDSVPMKGDEATNSILFNK